jgi:hypothetical protein
MFCHGICKVNSNQVIWSSQHKFFCEVQPKTCEVHVTNFCDLELKHMKTSQIFVISNWNIWSSCHIFLWSPTESFDLASQFFALSTRQWTCCWVVMKCFPGGEWHTPPPFFLGYQPLYPSFPLILRWINLCHPLSFWAINHSSFIFTNLKVDQPALRRFMTQQGWTCNVCSNPFPGKLSSTSWTIYWPVTTKSWELRKICLKNG